MEPITLLLMALATWRLSNMLADPDQHGPFGMLTWLRLKAGMRYDEHSRPFGATSLAEGLLCLYCNSVWIGVAFAALYYLSPTWAFWISLPLALSAAAVWMENQ